MPKCCEESKATHHLFVDFKAAYDTIDRQKLLDIMLERVGLRQVDSLSCLLFNVALEGIIRRAGLQRIAAVSNHTIFTKPVQLLGFADDVNIITSRYAALKREAAIVGLVVNTDNTKYMRPILSKDNVQDRRNNVSQDLSR